MAVGPSGLPYPARVGVGLAAVLASLISATPAAGALDIPERVADINPGPVGSQPFGMTSLGRNVLFHASEPGAGSELWRSDGSEERTDLVADIIPGAVGAAPSPAVVLGSTLLMILSEPAGGDEPWRSDGTAAGTERVADINPGAASANPRGFVALDSDTVLFRAEDPVNGIELRRTDGSSAGTELVADINPGVANGLAAFFFPEVEAGVAYFRASDPVAGSELWRSDGTAAGTELVANINLVGGGSAPLEITAAGDWIYLLADDGVNGRELWRSDGEQGGTYELVEDFDGAATDSGVTGLTAFGDRVYFRAPDAGNGVELMRSAGPGMTELVADINPVGDSNPQHLTPLGPWLYFTAVSGALGRELWRSDGIPGGTTELVADINPAGSSPCAFPSLTPFAGKLYLCASDGTSGNELWRSDGTAAGTERVADINPGAAGSAPSGLSPHGDTIYFQADDGVAGPELWALDLRPPDTAVVGAPAEGGHIADSTPPLALASQAIDLDRFECDNAGAFAECAGRDGAGSTGPLADGEQTLLIRAVDVRDNPDPTPEARTFTVDTTPPPITVARRKLPINRRGIAKLKLGCAATELTGPCEGRLQLKTRRRVETGKRKRRLKVAKASFELEPGEKLRLKLPLKPAKLELLADDRRARRLVARLAAADALGNRGAAKKRLRARLRGR